MRVLTSSKTDTSRFADAAAGAFGAPSGPISTSHFNIGSLPSLGAIGETIAQELAQRCEGDRNELERLFGVSVPQFNIIIAPLSSFMNGTGGAFHMFCSSVDIFCDAKIVPTIEPLKTCSLAVAEMVEVYEDAQGGGWDCGASNGEGLSRVIADERYLRVMDDYSTAVSWLDSFRPDYVNATAPSDLDPISNGCSVLFLNYLHSVLKYRWDQICQSPAPTLAGTYQRLTGDTGDPFPKFKALLEHMFPSSRPSYLQKDNPWRIDP
jgi:hypothetical protein